MANSVPAMFGCCCNDSCDGIHAGSLDLATQSDVCLIRWINSSTLATTSGYTIDSVTPGNIQVHSPSYTFSGAGDPPTDGGPIGCLSFKFDVIAVFQGSGPRFDFSGDLVLTNYVTDGGLGVPIEVGTHTISFSTTEAPTGPGQSIVYTETKILKVGRDISVTQYVNNYGWKLLSSNINITTPASFPAPTTSGNTWRVRLQITPNRYI